jgi:mono/diheme cytochrome c family protein
MVSRLALLLPLLTLATAVHADKSASERGRIDYILHCSGCHAQDGRGLESKGIPAVKDQIGYYLRLPEGRAFVMQVPGLLSAGMSDERAAGVVNWMIEYFAGPSMPPDFVPYTAAEARRYRETKPADVAGTRRALAARLVEMGYPFR